MNAFQKPYNQTRWTLHIIQILKLLQGDAEVSKWAKQLSLMSEEHEYMDDDLGVPSDIQSHLNLALLDLEVNDHTLSVSCTKLNMPLRAYFQRQM